MHGSENWILTEQTIARLKMFQSQKGKRILKIPKHYANFLPRVILQLPSMKVRILIRKLYFLAHLLTSNDNTLGPTTVWTLAMCNVDDISLANSADGLRATLPMHDSITHRCLRYPEEATSIIYREELDLLKRDKNLTLMEASKHQSLKRILNIKCWLRVWDKALDRVDGHANMFRRVNGERLAYMIRCSAQVTVGLIDLVCAYIHDGVK